MSRLHDAVARLQDDNAPSIARASDHCPCDLCESYRLMPGPPSDSQIDVTDAVRRIEQAKVHEARVREISIQVNGLLEERKSLGDTADILRKEAADILAGIL